MARPRKKKTDPELTPSEAARNFKSVTIDGDTVITNHGLKDLRDDEQANDRAEGFRKGQDVRTKTVTARYQSRSFLGPALAKNLHKIPSMWRVFAATN